MAEISHILSSEKELAFGRNRWRFRSDTLRSYGVIQLLDLSLYTFHNEISLPRSVVEGLVLDQGGGFDRVEQAPLRDLKATEYKAEILLDDVSLPTLALRRQAIRKLVRYWNKHDGAGDGKFVLGVDEASQLVNPQRSDRHAA